MTVPRFIKSGLAIIKFIGESSKVNKFSTIDLEILINNNVDDAKAWITKYFTDASMT